MFEIWFTFAVVIGGCETFASFRNL